MKQSCLLVSSSIWLISSSYVSAFGSLPRSSLSTRISNNQYSYNNRIKPSTNDYAVRIFQSADADADDANSNANSNSNSNSNGDDEDEDSINMDMNMDINMDMNANANAKKKNKNKNKNKIGNKTKNSSNNNNNNNNIMKRKNQKEKEKPLLGVPSYKTLLVFVSTTFIIWLSEPLLSLVDTAVVSKNSKNSIIQVAALGPATMLIDSAIFMTYFLSIATTNTVATALAQNDNSKLHKSSSQVLGLAGCLGVAITIFVFAFSRPMLTSWAGTSSSPHLIQLAVDYCRIRISVAPLAIIGMVAQSICLACLDTKTPAIAVALASIVNLAGDMFLVRTCNMGIQGAAIATAAATIASTGILMREVANKMKEWTIQQNGEVNGTSHIAKVVNGLPILDVNITALDEQKQIMKHKEEQNNNANVPILTLPNKDELWDIVRMAGPIFFVMFGKTVCYNGMTIKATDFGVTALATHNIMLRIFFFFSTLGDSVSQASQTFLPKVIANKSKRASVKVIKRLGVISAGIGVFNLAVSRIMLERLGSRFTHEASIVALMASNAKFMPLASLLHPFIMLFEGATLAAKDLIFLALSYGVTMSVLFTQLNAQTKSFAGVWVSLFIFQLLRLGQFSVRVWNKILKPRKKNDDEEGMSLQL